MSAVPQPVGRQVSPPRGLSLGRSTLAGQVAGALLLWALSVPLGLLDLIP